MVNDVTLTPTTTNGITLTIGADRSITQSGTADHDIKVGGTTSELGLPAGAGYIVKSANGAKGSLTVDTNAKLILGSGVLAANEVDGNEGPFGDTLKGNTLVAAHFATNGEALIEAGQTPASYLTSLLILQGAANTDGATLVGTGTVVAGETVIGGTWQAVSANATAVAIGNNVIFGGAALTGVTGGSGTIDVTATSAGSVTLGVLAKIDVAVAGTVTLSGDASNTNAAKMLLNGGTFLNCSLKAADTSDTSITIPSTVSDDAFFLGTGTAIGVITKADGNQFATGDSANIVAKAAAADASSGVALDTLGGGTGDNAESVLVTSDANPSNKVEITGAVTVTCPNA
jgi:hypothetical protein